MVAVPTHLAGRVRPATARDAHSYFIFFLAAVFFIAAFFAAAFIGIFFSILPAFLPYIMRYS